MRGLVLVSLIILAGCGDLAKVAGDAAEKSDEGKAEAKASAQREDQLIGGWSCLQRTEKGTATADVNYASGGRFSAQLEMDLEEDGSKIEMFATAAGTWELEDDKLTEEVTKLTIVNATVNGIAIEDIAAIKRFEDSMVNQVSTSTIKTLDEENLLVTADDSSMSCDRG